MNGMWMPVCSDGGVRHVAGIPEGKAERACRAISVDWIDFLFLQTAPVPVPVPQPALPVPSSLILPPHLSWMSHLVTLPKSHSCYITVLTQTYRSILVQYQLLFFSTLAIGLLNRNTVSNNQPRMGYLCCLMWPTGSWSWLCVPQLLSLQQTPVVVASTVASSHCQFWYNLESFGKKND